MMKIYIRKGCKEVDPARRTNKKAIDNQWPEKDWWSRWDSGILLVHKWLSSILCRTPPNTPPIQMRANTAS